MATAHPVDPLEGSIDRLYQLPLAEFTAARNGLAREQAGDARARILKLEKPTAVPWAVNQLYWRARPVFERLMKAGAALRQAQIDALEGRANVVAKAAAAHRAAVAAAVRRAAELSDAGGPRPAAEPLTRMLETLSTAPAPPAFPGRFTETVRPSGFEAMAGVVPAGRALEAAPRPPSKADARRRADAHKRERQAALHEARRAFDEAAAAEARAQMRLTAAREQLAQRESEAADARREVQQAKAALRRAGQRRRQSG